MLELPARDLGPFLAPVLCVNELEGEESAGSTVRSPQSSSELNPVAESSVSSCDGRRIPSASSPSSISIPKLVWRRSKRSYSSLEFGSTSSAAGAPGSLKRLPMTWERELARPRWYGK